MNDKDAGVLFEEDLFIYFKYHKDTDTVEVWRNGELISSGEGGGVTPEQLYQILQGYVSKPELAEALLDYLTEEDLEGYITNDQLILTLANYTPINKIATDNELGLFKSDSTNSITVDENGVLVIGGRLGQFNNGGVYYPTTIIPTMVGASSFLMSDGAKGLAIGPRAFGIMAGVNITCKNASIGSTEYRISNTTANRFLCRAIINGRLALNQNDAIENGTAQILSIKFANGDDISVYFGDTEADNDIIITVDRTVNPNATTKALRGYGTNSSSSYSPSDNILVGQGVGSSNGKAICLGMSCFTGGNQTVAIGNSVHVMANNSVGLGNTILVNKQFCLGVGQGHDFTDGQNGTTAVGIYSLINSNTKLAVGNGSANNRSNIFEVVDDNGASGVIIKSPNGTRYKLSVADDGTLSTTTIVE